MIILVDLVSPVPIYCGEEVEFGSSEIDKLVPPLQLTDSGPHHHGFTLVGESGDTEKTQPLKVNTVHFNTGFCDSHLLHFYLFCLLSDLFKLVLLYIVHSTLMWLSRKP